ncbi:hypothetical protein DSL72_000288 [Monilinia vaccinii-corymbosi]|uniref:Uncharacterized protein n=1 Tax=Monilinia vaccinii-corymbosi TaxID=61207 RepID=A0A8A3P2J8_9HELO|nr:hypothetical protein DSL72_000288 [Monilinia vaccinii-corymbosi]
METISGIKKLLQKEFENGNSAPCVREVIINVSEGRSFDLTKPIVPLCLHTHTPKQGGYNNSGDRFLPTELDSIGTPPEIRPETALHLEGWQYDREGLWVELALPCEVCVRAYQECDIQVIYYAMGIARRYLQGLVKERELSGSNDAFNIIQLVVKNYDSLVDDKKGEAEAKWVANHEQQQQKDIHDLLAGYIALFAEFKGCVKFPENSTDPLRHNAPPPPYSYAQEQFLLSLCDGSKPSRSPTPDHAPLRVHDSDWVAIAGLVVE